MVIKQEKVSKNCSMEGKNKMRQIRHNVFETNSSSTHSLVMAIASDFDKWVKGEVYHCGSAYGDAKRAGFEKGKFYSKEKVESYYSSTGEERDTYNFCTYDEFIADEELENSEYSYTTPNGEVVKVVAKYGFNG